MFPVLRAHYLLPLTPSNVTSVFIIIEYVAIEIEIESTENHLADFAVRQTSLTGRGARPLERDEIPHVIDESSSTSQPVVTFAHSEIFTTVHLGQGVRLEPGRSRTERSPAFDAIAIAVYPPTHNSPSSGQPSRHQHGNHDDDG